MKAIMYHYVRPYNPRLPILKHLHIDDFCKQLDYFQENYGFVDKEKFLSYFNGTNYDQSVEDKGVILTFDDGLSCHYDFVYPELKRRGLWGIFYIPTGVYKTKKLLDVHRTHILLASCNDKQVFEVLNKKICNEILIDANRVEFKSETYKTQIDGDYTKMVKRILNYYIDYQYREQILDELIDEFDLRALCQVDNFYMNDEQMKQMKDDGMVIGSHSVTHPVMSKLTNCKQRDEIQHSFACLNNYIDIKSKTFCYPYGGKHSYTKETIDILNQENCIFSFDVNSRDIAIDDILMGYQTLSRYDCNEFPYGQVR